MDMTRCAFRLCLAYVCIQFPSNCHKTRFDAFRTRRVPDGSRLAPLTCCVKCVGVGTKTVDKPQFDAQARRVADRYHAARLSLMFGYVCTKFISNCHKTQFDAKPDGLRMDITLAPLTCVQLMFVWVFIQTVDEPQFDAQARRVSDEYHASRPSPMFSLDVRKRHLETLGAEMCGGMAELAPELMSLATSWVQWYKSLEAGEENAKKVTFAKNLLFRAVEYLDKGRSCKDRRVGRINRVAKTGAKSKVDGGVTLWVLSEQGENTTTSTGL